MALQPSPLLRGFEQGADGTDQWNRMMPGEERGPLTLDPQGVALGQQFAAIKAGIEAQQTRPIWDVNNPVGTETVQSMGMPQPTTYAGPVGQFIDPATGRMTEQGAARMQNPMLGVDTGGLGMIKAFHGSPHAFDAFSDHAIGTGEGAQAYGYGHYLAENEGVARGYRDALAGRGGAVTAAQEEMQNRYNDVLKASDADMPAARAAYQEAYQALNRARADPGHMYEVNVAADPEKFLHWDKPLSEQSQHVRDRISGRTDWATPDMTGARLLGEIQKRAKNDPVAASQQLNDMGIPGIRYLDAGSRGAGEGSHNVVVFDPKNLEVIRRYGLAGLMGGGAAALAGGGNQEQ